MAQKIQQPNVFGRLGAGIGRALSEQIPKEVERSRLAAGLEQLGQRKDLSLFQQFAGLVGIPGAADRPQLLQSAGDLLRQQAIINSLNPNQGMPSSPASMKPYEEKGLEPSTATTSQSTGAALNPYIPPSGPEREAMARRLMAAEPQVYPNIEAARSAVNSQNAANVEQSNARLAKRELEESVQSGAEQKLRNEIATVGAQIPGTVLSNLQQQAVDDVATQRLSPDQAKIEYGKKADAISRSFSNIKSWGGLGLIVNNTKDLLQAMSSLHDNAKEGGYQKEAADAMIKENEVSPGLAYAQLYPVSDTKNLNEVIKSLPNIRPRLEKVAGAGPGLAGIGMARPGNANSAKMTLDIAPRLARAMGTEGSPLSIGYEIEKLGYDPQVWKQYIMENRSNLNLTDHQKDELEKAKPGYFGWLNDWLLRSFSGVK